MAETIWVYWENPPGVSHRPAIIDACLDTMFRNSGCEVILVSRASIGDYVDHVHPAMDYLSGAHQSDVFRLNVLASHGGMYLDADTIVLRSLRHLFSALDEFEYVGADWRPPGLPEAKHAPISVGLMGPCRPKLAFLEKALERQNAILDDRLERLRAGESYPIRWEEIMRKVVVPSYVEAPPLACMKDGANSWLALVGGPKWQPTPWHAFQSEDGIGGLPESELYTISNSLMPEQYRSMSYRELLDSPTILGRLLERAGSGREREIRPPR